MQYAKAIIAIIGAGVTAALGLIPPNTNVWQILTVVSALVTAAGVYLIPNTPPTPPPATHRKPPAK